MKKIIILLLVLITVCAGIFIIFKKNKKTIPDQILIYKELKTLILYKDQKKYEFPIATGKNTGDKQKVGDLRTPLGKFKIIAITKSDTWAYDFENDNKGPIVGADGKWQGIAIHGTHDESSIGKNDTHGCIRLRNKDVIFVKEMITINYPVEVFK